MNWTDFIRQHLVGDLFLDTLPQPVTLEYVQKFQSSVESFERLRQNRLTEGFFRYRQKLNTGERGAFRAIDDAIRRLQQYRRDPNQELLVDACNLMAVEFARPSVDGAYFQATDDGEHSQPLERA